MTHFIIKYFIENEKYNTTKDYIDFNQDKEYAGKEDF